MYNKRSKSISDENPTIGDPQLNGKNSNNRNLLLNDNSASQLEDGKNVWIDLGIRCWREIEYVDEKKIDVKITNELF